MLSGGSGKTVRLCTLDEELRHSDKIDEEVFVFDIEPHMYTAIS
jgi:hypothetical protein